MYCVSQSCLGLIGAGGERGGWIWVHFLFYSFICVLTVHKGQERARKGDYKINICFFLFTAQETHLKDRGSKRGR